MLEYLRLILDGHLSPSHGQGRVLLTPALTPASPCTGSSLSQSSLPAQKKSIWLSAGLRSCTSSDEHQSWSKANRKIMGLGARRERARSGAFFHCGGVNTSNTALCVSQASFTTCALYVYNGDHILSNHLIPSLPLTRTAAGWEGAVISVMPYHRLLVVLFHRIVSATLRSTLLKLSPWVTLFCMRPLHFRASVCHQNALCTWNGSAVT